MGFAESGHGDTITLKLRSVGRDQTAAVRPIYVTAEEQWDLERTAVIVCDVWDLHHCLNAVRRLEEFSPRLNLVLKAARSRGATVIHAPSDCMPAYADHPARRRAIETPRAKLLPKDIVNWCSALPSEHGQYPIDQSDGGEDDDPAEHAKWAEKLTALGRNPGTPWKQQSNLISIDAERDFISDRGDEVWSILESRGRRNVILTGVHCNMCVLGRPFGLRQMVRHGKHVVLMRDMTDIMYSPGSWPYVDHFTGHDMVIQHVEDRVCPTITSDQFLGGEAFRWKADQRELVNSTRPQFGRNELPADPTKHWSSMTTIRTSEVLVKSDEPRWFRSALLVPSDWLKNAPLKLQHYGGGKVQLWVNGREVQPAGDRDPFKYLSFVLSSDNVVVDDYNLLVLKVTDIEIGFQSRIDVSLILGTRSQSGIGPWQVRLGNDPKFANIPLPAKFGIGPDAVILIPETGPQLEQ